MIVYSGATTGNVVLQWAQLGAVAYDLTVKQNSFIEYIKIN
jgi:hypothetical protein